MPGPSLWDKFKQIVALSKVFQLMSPADQAQLLTDFEQATDQQLLEAIRAIQEEDHKFSQSEQAKLTQAQQQIILSEQLHLQIKNSEKELLVVEEEEDNQHNLKTLENIEAQLNSNPQKQQ